ncbi:hypothetical protein [Sphingomonas fennica]|uniref:Uncharacterized protein n=1 Tax=Edaphosphingomonas fennica TaxID=114404 RepID=A0A2T4I566_9SPHN|nr:hypothetical protein [Sphingomonas fennica]PTD25135.1 hypothetical protein CV103_06070 [Sphingomonas fennica]
MTDLAIPSAPAASPAAPATALPRRDGWTPERQRAFLEAVAEGHTVEAACRIVGLSVASAYAFRRRANGAAFALGWQAAALQAREKLADILLSRAIDGQVETVTRANGDVIERHRFDNRLATAMLTRMDRLADARVAEGTHQAARLIAQEWEAFLDLVGRDCSPARAGLFLGLRVADGGEEGDAGHDLAPVVALARADRWLRGGGALAGDVDISDLDMDGRAGWTADQWARAEAAGLIRVAAPDAGPDGADGNPQLPQLRDGADAGLAAEDEPVWWDAEEESWFTRFPPPPGFRGPEDGEYGDPDYCRALSRAERAVVEARHRYFVDGRIAADAPDRDRWFGFVPSGQPEEEDEEEQPDDPEGDAEDAHFRRQCAQHDAAVNRLNRLLGLYDADEAWRRGKGPDPLGLENSRAMFPDFNAGPPATRPAAAPPAPAGPTGTDPAASAPTDPGPAPSGKPLPDQPPPGAQAPPRDRPPAAVRAL